MKKIILFLTIISTIILANNPRVYAALGDVIYDNVDNIEKLGELDTYANQHDTINTYVQKVKETKENGFSIEAGDKTVDKKSYLNSLRKLSRENDYFVRSANNSYKRAIKNENSELFSKIINSGLIDTQRNKEEIINYYFAHQEDINASGVIQGYLDEDEKLRAKREAQKKRYISKKEREAAKIKRIRENDKREQEKLEKLLQEEVNQKKKTILKDQKQELFN